MGGPTDVEYLTRVARLNPSDQVAEIMTLRRAWLAGLPLPESASAKPEAPELDHDFLADRLNLLRTRFWSLDAAQIAQELDELRLDDFPDLRLAAMSLRTVASRLAGFRRLADHPHCFPEFLDLFHKLVLAAPRQAVGLRRELESTARRGMAYPSRRSPREFRRIARTIETEFPEVASLQPLLLAKISSSGLGERLQNNLLVLPLRSMNRTLARGLSAVVIVIVISLIRAWLSQP